jgi:DNA-binding NarL/FixJ family response regulator
MGGRTDGAGVQGSGVNPQSLTDPVSKIDDRQTVLYVDTRQPTRECVSEQLAIRLPEWVIESADSVRGYLSGRSGKELLLVILHLHCARVDEPGITEETERIAESWPNAPLILMSDTYHRSDLAQAFSRGVRGYILNDLPIRQVVAAIRLVSQGGLYLPVNVMAPSSTQERPSLQTPANQGNRVAFSKRQLQVITLLHQGKQNKIIAYELKIRECTVKVYVRQIMKKLHVSNRTQVMLQTSPIEE